MIGWTTTYDTLDDDGTPLTKYSYDVAVLSLAKPSQLPPAAIALRADDPALACGSSALTVAGWGLTETERPSQVCMMSVYMHR